MLRRYLADKAISSSLAVRVQRNAQHVLVEQKRNAAESSVELLSLISSGRLPGALQRIAEASTPQDIRELGRRATPGRREVDRGARAAGVTRSHLFSGWHIMRGGRARPLAADGSETTWGDAVLADQVAPPVDAFASERTRAEDQARPGCGQAAAHARSSWARSRCPYLPYTAGQSSLY